MERENFRLISGGKDKPLGQADGFEPDIEEKSKIKEEKVFSKGEIIGLIEQIAKAEGFKRDHLEIIREIYDKDHNLLNLIIRVIPRQSIVAGWRSIEYNYIIKGEHGVGSTDTSTIMRIYNLENKEAFEGGIVAEYENGKWQLSPGNVALKIEELEHLDE